MFNTPRSWVQYAKDYMLEGRGDILEGVFAASKLGNKTDIIENNKRFDDVESEYISTNRLRYFRRKYSMQLPCYCLYYIPTEFFTPVEERGEQFLQFTVPGSYFRDFQDNLSIEDDKKLPKEKQAAVVWITDQDKFKQRILDKLLSLGLEESEIIMRGISYENLHQEFRMKLTTISPEELTTKDMRFRNQSEFRIIVDTKKPHIISQLKKPIQIGDISDIAQYLEGYRYDGILIKLKPRT